MKGQEKIWGPEVRYEAVLRLTKRRERYMRQTQMLYMFLKRFPGIKELSEFTPVMIQDWLILRGREIAPRTLRDERDTVRGFFQWCVTEGYIKANPLVDLALPPQNKLPVTGQSELSLESLQRLVQTQGTEAQQKVLSGLLRGASTKAIAADLTRHPSTIRSLWRQLCTQAGTCYLQPKHFQKSYSQLCHRLGEQHLWQSLQL